MTNTSVLTTIALYDEWKNYCKENGLPWISADDLFHSDTVELSGPQRTYIFNFIQRWEAAQRAEDEVARTNLKPHVTEYRGLKIEGVCWEPAASERELATYRQQITLDVERRNRNLSPKDIGIKMGAGA